MAIYACSDLHGRYDLYQKIKAFINEDDYIIFLGDACDRGPDGWKLVKAIYEDEQFIYIKGNHEDMLVRAGREYFRFEETRAMMHLISNGGRNTWDAFIADPDARIWIERLDDLQEIFFCLNKNQGLVLVLTHAGYTPHPHIGEEYLWNREHFLDPWPEGPVYENIVMIHGHTPIALMDEEVLKANDYDEEEPGAFWYCDNHKVNLDVGSVWNDYAVLLNLDTLDEEIIY